MTRYNLAVQTNTPALRQYAKTLVVNFEYLRDFLSAKARKRVVSAAPSPRR